jgi:hypothetical protein
LPNTGEELPEGIEQGRGYGHTARNPSAALFETFEHQHADGEIDPVGGQRQGFGEPAAAAGQRNRPSGAGFEPT